MSAPGWSEANLAQVPGSADHELYEFPGRFDDSRSAEAATRARIQATEAGFETVEAASTVRTLGPGQTFTPVDVAKPDNVFAKQVMTAIRHVATDPTYETGGGVPSYDNTFTAIPADKPATPHRYQRRPRIDGTQIALIAGPKGEEIYTDQYGRVKVWFPWDRRARKDGSDTCWIRVGQPWAGGGWGYQTIPRVGMEAIVSYQEGDPDRPFILALVPDTINVVPYDLPTYKTRTVIKTNTYKGLGFNELRFDDATNMEEVFVHAQKDFNTVVENDETRLVKEDRLTRVRGNEDLRIGGIHNLDVLSSSSVSISGNLVHSVGHLTQIPDVNFPYKQADQSSFALKKSVVYRAKNPAPMTGHYTLNVKGDFLQSIGGDYHVKTAADGTLHASGMISVMSGRKMILSTPDNAEIDVGKKMIIEAEDEIRLVVGKSVISIKQSSITIKSAKIEIN